MHRGALRRRQVDAGVDVEPRALGIERLQGDRRERQPLLAGKSSGSECPHEQSGDADRCDPEPSHHTWATACSTALKPILNADSSLCATFSAPPIAPGTLNTTSSAASAKRWGTGVYPSLS